MKGLKTLGVLEWSRIHQILSKYKAVWREAKYKGAIGDYIPCTALLGNGDVGVTSYGTEEEKTYLISKGDFWNCGDLKTNALKGENPARVSPLTVGGVTIKLEQWGGSLDNFLEELDIARATVHTTMTKDKLSVQFEAWMAETENLLIIEATSLCDTSMQLSLSLWAKEGNDLWPTSTQYDEDKVYVSRETANLAKDNPTSWTSEVVMGMSVLGKKSSKVVLEPKEKVYIIIAVGGGGRTYNNEDILQQESPYSQAKKLLSQMTTLEAIEQLKAKHMSWWQNYWMKSWINIGDDKLHRYYYGSLYYLAATARQDKLTPGIMGNWITTDGVMWNGDYHMNYNMIAPFYGVYASNRPELAKTLKDPLLDYMEEGKRLAKTDLLNIYPSYINGGEGNKDFFEQQGGYGTYTGDFKGREDLKAGIDDAVLYPVALGPWGATAWRDEVGGYLTQMNDAGFSTQALTTYYRYTQDEEYLKAIYPLLVANANFFEKWCEKETLEDGSYRYIVYSGAHEGTFELNPPNTVGNIKNILSCLIDTAELMNPPLEKLNRWQDMFEHMAEYPIENYDGEAYDFDKKIIPLGEKGIKFVPCQAPVNLEFVAPSNQVAFNSSPELLEAIRNSIALKELAHPETWCQINNTPKLFTMAIKSGYDAAYVMDKFKVLLDEQGEENYTINDGVHGIEKAGGIEFIHNMLLQSQDNLLKVFPNWPEEKEADFVNLRGEGAFLVSSKYADQNVAYIKVESLAGKRLNIVSPWGRNICVKDEEGNEIVTTESQTKFSNEIVYSWETTMDKSYWLIQR